MILQRRINEARLALTLLTRLPAGRLPDPVPSLDSAGWAFPLVGLPVGLIGWAGFSVSVAAGFSPLLSALLSLAMTAWLTGALHHDGLADFADGIGGGHNRQHCLDIMRDSRIGSYGVVTLIFVVALQAAAISEGGGGISPVGFLLLGTASRLLMLVLLVSLPPARPDGLGRATASRKPAMMLPGLLITIFISFFAGPSIIMVLGVMCAAAFCIAALAQRCIHGQTGDVLGAAQIASETAGWVACSALL